MSVHSPRDIEQGRVLIAKGILSPEQAKVCLDEASRSQLSLNEIAQQRGLLSSLDSGISAQNPSNANAQLPQAQQVIGGYQVIRSLGRGGMGAVYLVRRQGVDYALKVILAKQDPEAEQRFIREAEAAAAVDRHPNIVTIHSFARHQGMPYLVLDYVQGQGLDELISRGPWKPELAIALISKLASALDHIHDQGITHRDLKPANILIRTVDGEPLITDFGLARDLNQETLTRTGEAIGTPTHMAPEQISAERDKLGPATDVWALATITYELLSGGERPFPGETVMAIASRVMNHEPVPISRHQPALEPRIVDVILQGLAKNPQRRYPSAGAFAGDLRRAHEGQRVRAASSARRALQTLPRALTIGLALCLSLGLLAWFFWPAPRDPRAQFALATRDSASLDRHIAQHIAGRDLKFLHPAGDSCRPIRGTLKQLKALKTQAKLQGWPWRDHPSMAAIAPRLQILSELCQPALQKTDVSPTEQALDQAIRTLQPHSTATLGQAQEALRALRRAAVEPELRGWATTVQVGLAIKLGEPLETADKLSKLSPEPARIAAKLLRRALLQSLFPDSGDGSRAPDQSARTIALAKLRARIPNPKGAGANWLKRLGEELRPPFAKLSKPSRGSGRRLHRAWLRISALRQVVPALEAPPQIHPLQEILAIEALIAKKQHTKALRRCLDVLQMDADFKAPKNLSVADYLEILNVRAHGSLGDTTFLRSNAVNSLLNKALDLSSLGIYANELLKVRINRRPFVQVMREQCNKLKSAAPTIQAFWRCLDPTMKAKEASRQQLKKLVAELEAREPILAKLCSKGLIGGAMLAKTHTMRATNRRNLILARSMIEMKEGHSARFERALGPSALYIARAYEAAEALPHPTPDFIDIFRAEYAQGLNSENLQIAFLPLKLRDALDKLKAPEDRRRLLLKSISPELELKAVRKSPQAVRLLVALCLLTRAKQLTVERAQLTKSHQLAKGRNPRDPRTPLRSNDFNRKIADLRSQCATLFYRLGLFDSAMSQAERALANGIPSTYAVRVKLRCLLRLRREEDAINFCLQLRSPKDRIFEEIAEVFLGTGLDHHSLPNHLALLRYLRRLRPLRAPWRTKIYQLIAERFFGTGNGEAIQTFVEALPPQAGPETGLELALALAKRSLDRYDAGIGSIHGDEQRLLARGRTLKTQEFLELIKTLPSVRQAALGSLDEALRLARTVIKRFAGSKAPGLRQLKERSEARRRALEQRPPTGG